MPQLKIIHYVSLLALVLAGCSLSSAPAVAPTTNARPVPTLLPTVPPAVPQPTADLAPSGAAPGEPLAEDMGMPGNKLAAGTAYTYDGPASDPDPSSVWFGVTNGAITEGLYPTIGQVNLKSLGLLVTDGKSFLADETKDAEYTVERIKGAVPAFRVTSTDREKRWAVVKTIVTDPHANTLLFTVSFQALHGRAEDYRLFLAFAPRLGGSGAGDLSRIDGGMAEAWDEQAGVYTTLASDPPPALLTTGYTSKNDIASDLADFTADTIYTQTTEPGRVTIGLELPTSGASTIALGFGASQDAARTAAKSSLQRGFASVSDEYVNGWSAYLSTLPSPFPNLPLYEESLATLKTLEDKTQRGAFVSSIATPWGQFATDADADLAGYRVVRPRDLYHVAMALNVAGDTQSARDALAYLDDVVQANDGSFPPGITPDGKARENNLELDQVALPIVLAWHLKAADRYRSLVKPAADFLVQRGPQTPRDRWGEPGGYAPATLAAEIAGLVCAADLARMAGDTASADLYLKTADEWNANVEKWTLTTSGPLGKGTYYIRASDGQPNQATNVTLEHNGGSYDQRAIVDMSFLELVRLGVRGANDPNILATLDVADAELTVKTKPGAVYARFVHDAYGESGLGKAPDGHGNAWPLLIGEHSVFQVDSRAQSTRRAGICRRCGQWQIRGACCPSKCLPTRLRRAPLRRSPGRTPSM